MYLLEYCNDDEREQTLLGEFETVDDAKACAQLNADECGGDGTLVWRPASALPGPGRAPGDAITTWEDGEGYFIWPA